MKLAKASRRKDKRISDEDEKVLHAYIKDLSLKSKSTLQPKLTANQSREQLAGRGDEARGRRIDTLCSPFVTRLVPRECTTTYYPYYRERMWTECLRCPPRYSPKKLKVNSQLLAYTTH